MNSLHVGTVCKIVVVVAAAAAAVAIVLSHTGCLAYK